MLTPEQTEQLICRKIRLSRRGETGTTQNATPTSQVEAQPMSDVEGTLIAWLVTSLQNLVQAPTASELDQAELADRAYRRVFRSPLKN